MPEPETWPDLDPVTMDSNEASKIFFTCTFDIAPGVSKISSLGAIFILRKGDLRLS